MQHLTSMLIPCICGGICTRNGASFLATDTARLPQLGICKAAHGTIPDDSSLNNTLPDRDGGDSESSSLFRDEWVNVEDDVNH